MLVPIGEKAALEAPDWGRPSRRREEQLGLVGASGLKRSEPRRGHETAQFTHLGGYAILLMISAYIFRPVIVRLSCSCSHTY